MLSPRRPKLRSVEETAVDSADRHRSINRKLPAGGLTKGDSGRCRSVRGIAGAPSPSGDARVQGVERGTRSGVCSVSGERREATDRGDGRLHARTSMSRVRQFREEVVNEREERTASAFTLNQRKREQRGLTHAGYMQLYLDTTMGAFERNWMGVLITANLRGRAVLVHAGQPCRATWKMGNSRSVAGGVDQPANGAHYEVIGEACVAPLPHVTMFATGI